MVPTRWAAAILVKPILAGATLARAILFQESIKIELMSVTRRSALKTVAAATALPIIRGARAQAPRIKIGVLNDQSGTDSDTGGATSIACTKQALEDFGVATKGTTALVKASGGKVLGAAQYPFPGTTDFSSFLVQAQASGAKVLGLANAGGDTVNSIKQGAEFGLNKSMKVAALLMFINDVHALGLETAGGLNLTESFYWDLNDRTRAFTKRVLPKTPTNYPNMDQAGCYSATLH